MYLLILGLVTLGLKIADLMPVADWSWWAVLSPLGLAVVWWTISDATGYTNVRAARRQEARRLALVKEAREEINGISKDNRL